MYKDKVKLKQFLRQPDYFNSDELEIEGHRGQRAGKSFLLAIKYKV